jgi:hypothetical protein
MRAACRSILLIIVFCCAVCSQTLTPGFQFPATVKPGDSETITGTDLAGITSVVLKATGKPDRAATAVQATPTSVTFTVPQADGGSYTVAFSPGTITPIPLTVTPLPANAGSAPDAAVTPPTAGSVPISTIYMPDGQLHSHPIRVYVTQDILSSQNPKLYLLRSHLLGHAVTEQEKREATPEKPSIVAPGQQWMESFEGQPAPRKGTLLLLDLTGLKFGLKPMLRVTPMVTWTDGGVDRFAVGSGEVNVGNIVAAILWTLFVLGLALAVIIWLSRRAKGGPLTFLTGADGHLSLAQTQIALWTVAVGGVVLGYGLIRVDIPDIPASLLVLMGASLATGGIGFFQDTQKKQAAVNSGATLRNGGLALVDLVRVFSATEQPPELSLAKAQMLFWTVLLLVLFVAKSILDGAIWDVPWPLVALMGFSQAGYLAPKLTPQPPPALPVEPPPAPPVELHPAPPVEPPPAPPVEPPPAPPVEPHPAPPVEPPPAPAVEP